MVNKNLFPWISWWKVETCFFWLLDSMWISVIIRPWQELRTFLFIMLERNKGKWTFYRSEMHTFSSRRKIYVNMNKTAEKQLHLYLFLSVFESYIYRRRENCATNRNFIGLIVNVMLGIGWAYTHPRKCRQNTTID